MNPLTRVRLGFLGVGEDDLRQHSESLTPASQLDVGLDISGVRKDMG